MRRASFLQELQQKNERQLLLIRDFSEQVENQAASLKAEMEAEKEALRKKMEAELDYIKQQRQEQVVKTTFRLFCPD